MKFKYCNELNRYSRFNTREVMIGDVGVGSENPIRIQSMTTTNTMDTMATVEQTIRMVEAGCDYVRITAPSINEAKNLENIKNELRARGYDVPLIADIHFTPNAAEVAAGIVEKVRVNPGNYADKKKFQQIEYTDEEYQAELERIRERFTPLVEICKEHGTAMRIGTNHGSLSDRIMSRYGDTPHGMVESAMEFVRICRDLNYHDLVLSMKASNPKVMIQAYRLLVSYMMENDMDYPIHLGVTEAGDGEDGRVKSALGIGALLEDGIGDTIRVSLTEEPEAEAPVAIKLVDRYESRFFHDPIVPVSRMPYNPFEYKKRETFEVDDIGSVNLTKVVSDFSNLDEITYESFAPVGYHYNAELDKWEIDDTACDLIYVGKNKFDFDPPQNVKIICDHEVWEEVSNRKGFFPIATFEDYIKSDKHSFLLNFIHITMEDFNKKEFRFFDNDKTVVFVLDTTNEHAMAEERRVFINLLVQDIQNPVIIKRNYNYLEFEELMLFASTDIGALLADGFGDGVWVSNEEADAEKIGDINRLLFGILQAARVRISKTEYIACPSCGRTLFDLVEVTNKIRNRTGHLKGVKIGIMGCIVNGPGEMADADYGYVGSGVGKITLYRSKEVVKRNVDSEYAVDELINLIKEDGNWIDP